MPLLPSALPPKGEARRYLVNDFLNLIALPAQDNEPAVPRADPPLALPQNLFDFLPRSLYDRRKTKEDLL